MERRPLAVASVMTDTITGSYFEQDPKKDNTDKMRPTSVLSRKSVLSWLKNGELFLFSYFHKTSPPRDFQVA